MTVLVKFQMEIRFSIELHGNSKLSMTSCPPSSGYLLKNVICKFCDSGFIEDEFHFIMVCKLYTCHRVTLFSSLSDIANLNMFDENHIFKYIMSATDYDILFVVASFVKDAFEERSKIC